MEKQHRSTAVLEKLAKEEKRMLRIVDDLVVQQKYRAPLEKKLFDWRKAYDGDYRLVVKGNGTG